MLEIDLSLFVPFLAYSLELCFRYPHKEKWTESTNSAQLSLGFTSAIPFT